jgi:membrane protease YdiL (CAAX protease family)
MLLGAWSPTIASYIVLKKNAEISGVREWLKNIFYVKGKLSHYLLALLFVGLFIGIPNAISGSAITESPSVYMFLTGILSAFLIGGLEEAGWRYILQPGLDKRYGYILSSIISGVIWFAWHIPLLLIPGMPQRNLLMYVFIVIGMTFFFGAIIRIAGKSGIFMSVLAHTLINVAWESFPFNETWTGTIITVVIVVSISSIIVWAHEKRKIA